MTETVIVETLSCMMCGERSHVTVSAEGYRRWQAGVLVQNAFPEIPHTERELLITGTHPKCWDEMFATMPEE